MYSLGAKRRFPCSFWTPSRASRHNRASTSCGTMGPPNTRANALSTVASSLRSIRATSPRWLLMFYRSPALALRYCRCAANESPGCWFTPAWYRDSTTPRHFRNRENRIHAVQGRARGVGHNGRRATAPLRRFGNRAITVVWSIGCFPGEWRNGRRAGFRCQCPSGRGGSSPPSPTLSGSTKGHGLERGRDLRAFRGSAVRACARPTVIVGDGCRAGGAGLRVRCAPRPSAATARRSPGSGRRRCGPSPPSSTGPAHCRTAMRRRRVGEPRCRVPARCIHHERRGPRGPSRRSRPHSSAAPRAPARAAPAIRPAGGNRTRAATRHHHVAESERQLCCRTRS